MSIDATEQDIIQLKISDDLLMYVHIYRDKQGEPEDFGVEVCDNTNDQYVTTPLIEIKNGEWKNEYI